mgnify:FL=1|jgi:hypothetical protein|tara:strand:+ start:92 stop:232 length:141 start_codon:yes stop_codon:yes gene_type:complete
MTVRDSIEYIWAELDKTWEGDVRPDSWDTTCEHMAFILESLEGLEE